MSKRISSQKNKTEEFLLVLRKGDERVFLSYYRLGPNGAKLLSQELISTALVSPCTHLYLAYNQFGIEGAKYIADAIRSCPAKLTSLNEGAEFLLDAITENTKITELVLSFNDISLLVMEKIQNQLQKNRNAVHSSMAGLDSSGAPVVSNVLRWPVRPPTDRKYTARKGSQVNVINKPRPPGYGGGTQPGRKKPDRGVGYASSEQKQSQKKEGPSP